MAEFIGFYYTQGDHGWIGYMTWEQKHTGHAQTILGQRAARKYLAREGRLEINGKLKDIAVLGQAGNHFN